jgi:RNA polymerase sigma factor (sigma-70 family)
MDEALPMPRQTAEQNRRISEIIRREHGRLLNFIRRRVDDAGDAEDILQDVFSELVETYRLMRPVEQMGAWLYRVARNRIIDFFRRKRPASLEQATPDADEESPPVLEDLLPSPDAGPEAAYARQVLLEEIEAAIDELPAEQGSIFIAHEIEGRSFKDLASETGLSINTLLSRKHYAVLHLRRRLRAIYQEYMAPRGG